MRNVLRNITVSGPALLLVAGLSLWGACGDDNGGGVLAPVVTTHAGERARDFLTADVYRTLIVEVQPVSGMEPTQAAVDNLQQFLEARLDKPGGVRIVVEPPIAPPGKSAYSIPEIRFVEAQSRRTYTSGNTIAAFLLLIDGESTESSGNRRILGHAYGATSMVIYQAAVQELSGGIGEPDRDVLESTVINHEFGHLLGLVHNGTPAVDGRHHDAPNGAHCTNSECLMHYTVELGDVVDILLGGSVPSLDANCIADLKNNGGR